MPRNVFHYRSIAPRSGKAVLWLLLIVACAGGAAAWWTSQSQESDRTNGADEAILHTVARQDFSLEITERGEVQSASGIEVKSEVKTQNSAGIAILRIVPEGTLVAEGDFLVELDASALTENRLLQQILVNTAEASVIEARNLHETAVITRREYLDGLFVQERQTIESEVFVAEENLSRAQEYLQYSKRLATKGYVSDLQLEADRFAVEKSQKELDAAQTKLRVLEEFTKAKTLAQLDADIAIAKAQWESSKNTYELELEKLRDIEDQIAKCIMTAPTRGTVTYAHGQQQRGGGEEFVVEEGAVIRERQTIIRLPDISSMQVEVEVNESLIQYIEEGMPAAVRLVGVDDAVFQGRVTRVNQYAEPTNWRRANVKDYKAFVAIEEQSALLKTGMTASVTVAAMFVPDALVAPVQSIYAHGDQIYCFVADAEGSLSPREVTLGPTNDRFYVIKSGLAEADQVAVNPRQLLSLVDLPEVPAEQRQQAVDSGRDWRELRDQKPAQPEGGETALTSAKAVGEPG